jgi:hypothetical protein
MSLSRPNQIEYDRESTRVRKVLGEESWQAAWREGVKLTPEAALSLVSPGNLSMDSPGQSLAEG